MNKFKQITLAIATFLSVALLAGCQTGGNSNKEPSQGDANWVDYTQSAAVRLSLDYKGRDFYKDGIGQVKLYQDLVQESEIRTFLGSVISAKFRPEYESILADADIVYKYFYGHSGFNANAVITAKNCNVITLTYDDLKNDF